MTETTVHGSQTFTPALTTIESIAISSAVQRVQHNPHHNATVQAKTAISLILGRSKSKRRQQLVLAALEGAGVR